MSAPVMRPALLALLLIGSPSVAQTLTITLTGQNAEGELSFGAGDCAISVPGTWAYSGTACSDLQLWVTSATKCGDEPGTSDLILDSVDKSTVQAAGTAPFSFTVSELPAFAAADGGTCGAGSVQTTMRVCGAIDFDTGFTATCSPKDIANATSPPKIIFDSKPPATPSISSVGAGDRKLIVNLAAADTDTETFEVSHALAGTEDFSASVTVSTATSRVEIKNLANDASYVIRAYAVDSAGNQSAAFAEATGSPLRSIGLGEQYAEAGGQELGGCQAAGGSMMILGTVVALMAAMRRKRS